MRDTAYATEHRTASFQFNATEEARIERIYVKEEEQIEIRFSWWKEGRFMVRPLDLSENDLLSLMQNAVTEGVFTPEFRMRLKDIL